MLQLLESIEVMLQNGNSIHPDSVIRGAIRIAIGMDQYGMPEGLDTPEKHEQYLKDIGLKKQTAVEWLVEKIQQANPTFKFDALIRKAIKMEKEQIMDAYETAEKDCGKDFLHGDLYYHETYLQSHTPKHYRVWFEDTMEEEGGYWWNAVTDPCGRLYDPNHPNEERDTVQWYIDNGYKIEEVTNG